MTDTKKTAAADENSAEVTLQEVLAEREKRVFIQTQILKEGRNPLICFTMNIAGPIKTSPLIVRAFRYGLKKLDEALAEYDVTARRVDYRKCGPAAYIAVDGKAEAIKDICVKIEESCPLGRLFDMDVLDTNGKKLERKKERCCIVCGAPGRACAAGRLHGVSDLQAATCGIITEHFINQDPKEIAKKAQAGLLDEVFTTPKPGLVDSSNTGSHTDMDTDTFERSADALLPYFEECVRIGIKYAEASPNDTFAKLRAEGIKAEKAMYEATGGVNTHKGIIYSMGIILCAAGRLWTPDSPISDINCILEECSILAKESAERDFARIDNSTAGGRLYLLNGSRGIRGEAAEGFPSVSSVGLPVYKRLLNEGKNKNDAGVFTLLHLIAHIYDTSLFNRGGEEGIAYAKDYARRLLSKEDLIISDVEKMDRAFIEKNLSPGGSADLLAITYFLADIEKQRETFL